MKKWLCRYSCRAEMLKNNVIFYITLSVKSFEFTLKIFFITSGQGLLDAIAISVLGETDLKTIFRDLDDHMTDTAVNENHVFGLVKTISKNYGSIRMYHLGKEFTQNLTGVKVRKKMKKLVLFKHQ